MSRDSLFYQCSNELQPLLNASLNADLTEVKRICNAKQRENLLSDVGEATIGHSSIKRTGTVLQMALYSGDETMAEFLKGVMDAKEFKQQVETVFGQDYQAFLKKQQVEAKELCSELESTLNVIIDPAVNDPVNHIKDNVEKLRDPLKQFKIKLERYVKENSVHNPYILRCLFEFYDKYFMSFGGVIFHSPDRSSQFYYDLTRAIQPAMSMISIQAIGLIQKYSSACWLRHYAYSIGYLSYDLHLFSDDAKKLQNFMQNGQSFLIRFYSKKDFNKERQKDIRQLDGLGTDSFIDIFGDVCHGDGAYGTPSDGLSLLATFPSDSLIMRSCHCSWTENLDKILLIKNQLMLQINNKQTLPAAISVPGAPHA